MAERFAQLSAELIGDTSRFDRAVAGARGDLADLGRFSEKAGRDAGRALADGFTRDAAGRLRDAKGKFVGTGREMADALGGGGRGGFRGIVGTLHDVGGAAFAVRSVVGTVAAPIREAFSESIALEDSFVQIKKVAGLDAEGFAELEAGIKAMAVDAGLAGVSLDELFKIAETGGRLGIGEKEGAAGLLEYTRALAMVSIAMDDLPIDRAAESMGQILGVFGEGSDRVASFGSVVDKLADSTSASAEGIFDVTQRMAGMAANAGLSVPQTAALATAVLDMGNQAEMSGSALQRILALMLKDPAAFAKAAGMTADQFRRLQQTDPFAALQAAVGGIAKLEGAARLTGLDELGVDGVLAQQVMLGLAQRVSALNPLVAEANQQWQTQAQLQESVAINAEKTSAKLQVLENQNRLTAAAFGDAMKPALEAITPLIQGAAKDLADFVGKNKEGIMALADAIGRGIGGAFKLVTDFVKDTQVEIDKLRSVGGAFGEFLFGPGGDAAEAARSISDIGVKPWGDDGAGAAGEEWASGTSGSWADEAASSATVAGEASGDALGEAEQDAYDRENRVPDFIEEAANEAAADAGMFRELGPGEDPFGAEHERAQAQAAANIAATDRANQPAEFLGIADVANRALLGALGGPQDKLVSAADRQVNLLVQVAAHLLEIKNKSGGVLS